MIDIHQAWVIKSRPCPRRDPHVGVDGFTPSPRNETVASASMSRATSTVNWTTIGAPVFGSHSSQSASLSLSPSPSPAS